MSNSVNFKMPLFKTVQFTKSAQGAMKRVEPIVLLKWLDCEVFNHLQTLMQSLPEKRENIYAKMPMFVEA